MCFYNNRENINKIYFIKIMNSIKIMKNFYLDSLNV